jgi:release factor glutamine methyltransferase
MENRENDFDNKLINLLNQKGLQNSINEIKLLTKLVEGEEKNIKEIFEKENIKINQYVEMRERGIPPEYILKRANFFNRIFYCDRGVLIPRPETEILVQSSLNLIKKHFSNETMIDILDVGIGCGNISVSLAIEDMRINVLGVDISEDALKISKINIQKHMLENRINVLKSDLFLSVDKNKKFHVIVCNPPYIPSGSLQKLSSSITENEPRIALDAGLFGLNIFLRLIKDSPEYLFNGGFLCMEVGEGQDSMVKRILEKDGRYYEITLHDYNDVSRVITARMKEMV